MSELLHLVASPWAFLSAVLIFGFAPRFCLHLIVQLYPRGHPRRRELLAELCAVPRGERPFWVADVLATGVFEGPKARLVESRSRRATTPPVPDQGAFEVARLAKALSSLPPLEGQVMWLHLVDGLTPEQIAARVGLTGAEVLQLRIRATRKVRHALPVRPARPLPDPRRRFGDR